MADEIDFHRILIANQETSQGLKNRLDLLKHGVTDAKYLPNDLYEPLCNFSDDLYEGVESRYDELSSSHLVEYCQALNDLNSALILQGELLKTSFRRCSEDVDKSYLADGVIQIFEFQKNVSTLLGVKEYQALKSGVDVYKTYGDISRFDRANVCLPARDIDSKSLELIKNQALQDTCKTFNHVANLDMENLDIEMGYLCHRSDIDPVEIEKRFNDLMKTAGRAQHFLLMSKKGLVAVSDIHGAKISVNGDCSYH